MKFVAVAIVSTIVIGHPSFDWFKLHSPLFESQKPDHQAMSLSQIIKIIGKYVLLCKSFALSRIESTFAMEVCWDNRHQPHTSLIWKLCCHGNQSETSITHLLKLYRVNIWYGGSLGK